MKQEWWWRPKYKQNMFYLYSSVLTLKKKMLPVYIAVHIAGVFNI